MGVSFTFPESEAAQILEWLRDYAHLIDYEKVLMRTKIDWQTYQKVYVIVSELEEFNTLFKLCWSDRCKVGEEALIHDWPNPAQAMAAIRGSI